MNNDFININNQNLLNNELKNKIKKLKIPPNWKNIHIANNYNSKIQAFGFDNKNKKQYIYHPLWKIITNNIKFSNIENFNINKLNKVLQLYINNNNNFNKLYVISNMIQLMMDLNIRVGNEIYLKKNDTIGLCTMQKDNFKNNCLIFQGKKGIIHNKTLNSKHLNFINDIIKLPGKYLFQYLNNSKVEQINAIDLNNFLKKYVDINLSTKDIRTYQANKIFINYINKNKSKFFNIKKLQSKAIKYTANELGNTSTVCKNSYINPNNLLV